MLYKITLKQRTESIGQITANTLFGAFLTAYSNFITLDEDMIQDIVLSDLFPASVLPIGVSDNLTLYNNPIAKKNVLITRTLVARDWTDNNVVISAFANMGGLYEFYISTELLDIEMLTKIIDLMLEYGLGKWRNVGKGQFVRTKPIEEYVYDTNATRFLTLSAFIPDMDCKDDITETGYYIRSAVATCGKQQAPVCLFITGTGFKSYKETVGKHLYDPGSKTYIHGKSIVIGVA